MKHSRNRTSDEKIIRKVLEGDINAFEHLVERYRKMVFAIAARHVPPDDVAEVAQDVFVRAFRSLETFRGRSAFSHWISSIATRTCYDHMRKLYRSRELPVSQLSEQHNEWIDGVLSSRSRDEFNMKSREREARDLLDWALGQLSPQDRMVLESTHLEGLSVKETAKLLGWSRANVKVRAFRARRKLRRMLKDAAEKPGRNNDE